MTVDWFDAFILMKFSKFILLLSIFILHICFVRVCVYSILFLNFV